MDIKKLLAAASVSLPLLATATPSNAQTLGEAISTQCHDVLTDAQIDICVDNIFTTSNALSECKDKASQASLKTYFKTVNDLNEQAKFATSQVEKDLLGAKLTVAILTHDNNLEKIDARCQNKAVKKFQNAFR